MQRKGELKMIKVAKGSVLAQLYPDKYEEREMSLIELDRKQRGLSENKVKAARIKDNDTAKYCKDFAKAIIKNAKEQKARLGNMGNDIDLVDYCMGSLAHEGVSVHKKFGDEADAVYEEIKSQITNMVSGGTE